MNLSGIRYGAEISAAAARHKLDPVLLAAVAAQETGGPGSNSGRNVAVGADGHGRGLFQIDDRSWSFARGPAAAEPAKNADMAASILHDNLQRYGGNVTKALSAYNAGTPDAAGTATTWGDGRTLGYADSVMRHYAGIVAAEQGQAVADGRETSGDVNALASLSATQAAPSPNVAFSSAPVTALPLGAAALPQLPQPPAPTPAPAVPAGSQAQAAANVGAQADGDEASLVDQGDVFAASDDDA